MNINKGTVEKVAKLARLNLSDTEKEKYTRELSAILDYVGELQKVQGETPTDMEPYRSQEELRADESDQGRFQQLILGQAPTKKGDLLSVPAVFGEE